MNGQATPEMLATMLRQDPASFTDIQELVQEPPDDWWHLHRLRFGGNGRVGSDPWVVDMWWVGFGFDIRKAEVILAVTRNQPTESLEDLAKAEVWKTYHSVYRLQPETLARLMTLVVADNWNRLC